MGKFWKRRKRADPDDMPYILYIICIGEVNKDSCKNHGLALSTSIHLLSSCLRGHQDFFTTRILATMACTVFHVECISEGEAIFHIPFDALLLATGNRNEFVAFPPSITF